MVFVYVPAGVFSMGSDPALDRAAQENEQPQHSVHLDAFWIGKYPVTNLQYQVFVRAAGYRSPKYWSGTTIPDGKENHPVEYVSWQDATTFCLWVGSLPGGPAVRLPSEAEWEKAARGTDGRIYPWGNAAPDASLCNLENYSTVAVGQYSPRGDSPYGCADMTGNMFQWCGDWYGSSYYSASPPANPPGPESGRLRIKRGASWWGKDQRHRFARCADRNVGDPDNASNGLTFRVVGR
jgi:formylglycine-generating enzyme required for sulfatase activity